MSTIVGFWIEVILACCSLVVTFHSASQGWWFTTILGVAVTGLLAWFAWDLDQRIQG